MKHSSVVGRGSEFINVTASWTLRGEPDTPAGGAHRRRSGVADTGVAVAGAASGPGATSGMSLSPAEAGACAGALAPLGSTSAAVGPEELPESVPHPNSAAPNNSPQGVRIHFNMIMVGAT